MSNHLVVTSGGLDSTTTLFMVVNEHGLRDDSGNITNVKAISFDYGQRHKKELVYAKVISSELGIPHETIDITSITQFLALSGSSLVSDTEVPEGHYAEENMKATVVPNRNMIMTAIAAGHAIAIEATHLWLGVHAGDHFIYPDCRPEFFNVLNAAVVIGNEGFGAIPNIIPNGIKEFIHTPYIHKTKADIAFDAFKYQVPIDMTWSCYKGGELHCGRCGTCVERIEAIQEAIQRLDGPGIDFTQYEDNKFWQEALTRKTV